MISGRLGEDADWRKECCIAKEQPLVHAASVMSRGLNGFAEVSHWAVT